MRLKMDLQLFSDLEKTEEPTPKKRRDAREEGQVLQSREVTGAFILLAMFLGFKLLGKYIISNLIDFMTVAYGAIEDVESLFYENNLMIGFTKVVAALLTIMLPILLISFLAALIANYIQVGFLFTTKTLEVKLNRINPVEGFKRWFSKKALVELLKSIFRILVTGYVGYKFIKKNITEIINLSNLEFMLILRNFAAMVFSFSTRIIGVFAILAFLDYLFKWLEYEKELKMTKQEIKEEHKQTEGDPLIKSRIRESQRRIAMSRMMHDVRKADVIITNPTHIAVAIKYDEKLYQAPYVLAKGIGLVAENIKKVGRENSIILVENKALARTLYDTVEIGDLIPEDLYQAVAEVLAYVYSLRDDF
ncbi:MAG TPA: flagellar biosynthesis protein FlhB [Tepidimicrobium sp.]|nr:flagellar biosynthesis protein FlhB [Tepidimicrobium sp.]